MRSSPAQRLGALALAAILCWTSVLVAQPAAGPLQIQGLEQFTLMGVRSHAMGGTGLAGANDASAIFANPATLSRLSGFEIRAGGYVGGIKRGQSQDWVPMRPVPGLSVLFERMTGTVKKPDSLGMPGVPLLNPWSNLQEQYDDIDPDWHTESSTTQPLMLAAALPLTLGETRVTVGIGVAQIIDLDHYYQNNNSLSPYLGQERPAQVFFTDRNDTIHVKWYQYTRAREGSVYGITPALSVTVLPGFTLGASAAFLTGSSDDAEHRVERGHLNISITNGVADNFMLDTAYYYQDKVGTSTYTGNMFTFGAHLEQERFSIGLTVKPAMTLTREWERTTTSLDTTKKSFPVRIDSLTTRTSMESGTDKLRFPFSYSLGVILTPTDRWTIGFDFVWRNLGEAEFTSGSDGATTNPWVNSSATMRLGIEYRASDLLALRAGYRQDPQAFSPDGSAIINTPASGNVYSAGAGLAFGNILCDLAYEYRWLKYEDTYQSNVNINTQGQHLFFVEVGYRF